MSKWGNGWNDTDVYSTSEVKTNKVWIDGKPIYRKTLVGKTPPQNTWTAVFDISDLNIDTPTFMSGVIFANNQYVNVPCDMFVTHYNYPTVGYIGMSCAWTNYDIELTIEYTKTTD